MMLTGLILLSLALGLLAWLGFVWSVRSGQYDDPEGPKYRMLEDAEERAEKEEAAAEKREKEPVAAGKPPPA